jgi:psiF repeat
VRPAGLGTVWFPFKQKEEDMKKMIVAGLVAGMVVVSGAWAEGAQQNRMKSCNEDAGKQSLAGDARKAFMKSCLSGSAAPASAATPQQQRMKDCNAEAKTKEMKGDARKAFMKSCLSARKN